MARITTQDLGTKMDALTVTVAGQTERIDRLIATTEDHTQRIDALTASVDAKSRAVAQTFGEMRDFVVESVGQLRQDMTSRFDAVDKWFDGVDTRFDQVDTRLESVDKRLEGVDKRLDRIDQKLDRALAGRPLRAPRRRR